jgi:hypothetical protein
MHVGRRKILADVENGDVNYIVARRKFPAEISEKPCTKAAFYFKHH